MAGTLTIGGMAAGLPGGYKAIGPITMTGLNTIGSIIDTTLASGDNTFTIPTGAFAVLIALGSPSGTIKLRTSVDSGDTGVNVSPQSGIGFIVIPLPSAATTVILNSSGTQAGVELSFI
jgi:hypothetical protein